MYRHIASLIAFCAAFAVTPLTSSAAPITVPTDLSVGDQYRLAFATSTTRDATSTAIADYNAFVTAVATGVTELAALGTTWKAIGSTATVDARDNTGTNPSSTGVPIYRLNDTRIADDNADLWDGTLSATLSITETGAGVVPQEAWTGSLSDGTASGGPLGSSLVTAGITGNADFRWISFTAFDPSLSTRLYAMSGVLTVVPEPGTIVPACIAAAVLAASSLRRRRHRNTCGHSAATTVNPA